MIEFYKSLGGLDKTFFIFALAGGVFFVLRLVLSFFGGGDDGSDVPADLDVDLDHGGAGHSTDASGSSASFKILTIQGLTGFFMMFGLVGLTLSRGGLWPAVAILGGLVAGLGTVWILDRTFRAMAGMQSSGNIRIQTAVGQEGTVYLSIPPEGTGKVHLTISGRLREYNAVSETRTEIKTGERVRVMRVLDGSVLAVTKC